MLFWIFVAALLAPGVLGLPAWAYARRHQGATWLLLLLGVPAVLVWLLVADVRRPDLGNFIELPFLFLLSVFACYAQVFLLDRYLRSPRRTTAGLAAGLIGLAALLRLLMPPLPE